MTDPIESWRRPQGADEYSLGVMAGRLAAVEKDLAEFKSETYARQHAGGQWTQIFNLAVLRI